MSTPVENQTSPATEFAVGDSGGASNEEFTTKPDSVWIPRWIVYFQGALLGVVAATFFVFGLMVGNLTSGAGSQAEQKLNCRVSGQVAYLRSGQKVADANSVVVMLPVDKKPDQRTDSTPVHPSSFEPLDNPAIERVTSLGGAIVRVNERGSFDLTVDGPQEYYVLIVSANRGRDEGQGISKPQKAAIGTFFKPAEGVIGDQAFYWGVVYADRESIELDEVNFE